MVFCNMGKNTVLHSNLVPHLAEVEGQPSESNILCLAQYSSSWTRGSWCFPGSDHSFPTLLMAQCFFCCQGDCKCVERQKLKMAYKEFQQSRESAASFQESDISYCHDQTHKEIQSNLFLRLEMKKRKKSLKEHPSITITLNTLPCFILLKGIESLKVSRHALTPECQHLRKQSFFISNNYSHVPVLTTECKVNDTEYTLPQICSIQPNHTQVNYLFYRKYT